MSFRLKTILGIGAIEIFLLAILVFSGLNYLHSSTEDQLLNRASTTTRLFASMTSDAVIATDLATLDVLVDETIKSPGVVYARVRRKDGIVLSESGDAEALSVPFVRDESVESARSDERLDASHAIVVAGTTFGFVEIGISTAALHATIADATKRMMTLAGAKILLVAIFGFVLSGILTRQLTSIQMGARKVAAGEFGSQIDVVGRDELADTAKSFNKMSAALAEYADDLMDARERAEAGRDRAETVLQDAMESVPQGILIIDKNEKVLHLNSAYQNIYAADDSSLDQAGSLEEVATITSRHIAASFENMEMAANTSTPGQEPETRLQALRDRARKQWTSRLDDGRYLFQTSRSMQNGGFVIVETDVTPLYEAQERNRKLELERLQASKMESLGTLAGGIAHEINTPIQYIGDNLRFLSKSFEDLQQVIESYDGLLANTDKTATLADAAKQAETIKADADLEFMFEEVPEATKQSIEGVSHVSGIVLAMKEFSHPSSKTRARVDVNKVIERATTVCRGEWKHAAKLNLQLDPNLPTVMALEGELNQVILNMVVNAAHAVTEKDAGQGTITIHTAALRDGIEFSVSDTGTGIPVELVDRIFDPFFTTKDVGKGTGQGLAICHDIIVNKHGGTIGIESEEGDGTIFIMSLPAGDELADGARADEAHADHAVSM